MSKRRRPDHEVDIVELPVDSWGNPTSAPPLPPGPPTTAPPPDEWSTTSAPGGGRPSGASVGAWLRRHTNHLVAGAGAIALLVVVVAVASGPGNDPSAAPTTPPTTVPRSTTEPQPVETPAPSTTEAPSRSDGGGAATDDGGETVQKIDYRFALTETPDGFEITDASEIDESDGMMPGPAAPVLFAADGTTWQTGPWLTVSSSDGLYGPLSNFPFIRPPSVYAIGDAEARTGISTDGVEVTTLQRGALSVEIAGRGLDPLATAAVAEAVQLGGAGIALPDAAIPAGLRSRPDIDLRSWNWGWSLQTRAAMSFQATDQEGWMSFAVGPPGDETNWLRSAPYFLTDVRYVSIRGGSGIAGTAIRAAGDPTQYVQWRTADREYFATATGVALDDLLRYAGLVVHAGDPQWRADMWADARDAASQCCQEPRDRQVYVPVDVPTAAGADDEWQGETFVGDATLSWNFMNGGPNGDAFSVNSPLGAPLLQVGSRYGWAGMTAEFPAAAVAIVDRSMIGSVLRLTTTGSAPQTIDVALQPVAGDRLAPYLLGATVLPWIDGGFIAQLIAPDGQTIAVQTDADLP